MSARVATLLRDGAAALAEHSPSARIDVEVLLAHVLGKPRTFLYTWPEHVVPQAELERFSHLLARRRDGEPVAWLTGEREFYGRPFLVSPATLIPRPETELLVDLALAHAAGHERLHVLDLGTGTGAVAISVALARPAWRVRGVELMPEALELARRNAAGLGAGNVELGLSDWWSAVDERFDLVLSNPPYVAAGDPHLERGDVRFEPASALLAGTDGLDAIRSILEGAGAHLVDGGMLAVEHGHEQGEPVRLLFRAAGFSGVRTLRDLAGHERVTLGVLHAE